MGVRGQIAWESIQFMPRQALLDLGRVIPPKPHPFSQFRDRTGHVQEVDLRAQGLDVGAGAFDVNDQADQVALGPGLPQPLLAGPVMVVAVFDLLKEVEAAEGGLVFKVVGDPRLFAGALGPGRVGDHPLDVVLLAEIVGNGSLASPAWTSDQSYFLQKRMLLT